MQWNHKEPEPSELAEDLAKTLPRWVGWVPVLGKAGYRKWKARQLANSPARSVHIELMSGRIDAAGLDTGAIDLHFSIVNFGRHEIEIDRLELHALAVGSRHLQRRGDMMKLTGTIPPRTVTRHSVYIDLHSADIRALLTAIGRANNAWSTPQASLDVYGEVLCLRRSERFRKTIQAGTAHVQLQIATEVVEHLTGRSGAS